MKTNLHIPVSPELKELVDLLPSRKIAPNIRYALAEWLRDGHVLYKVSFESRCVVYYGHTLKSDYYGCASYILELKNRDTPLAHDFDIFPISEFSMRVVASFERLDDLLLYRDMLLNDRLDKGLKLYNDEVVRELVPRIYRIMLPYKIARLFGDYCSFKGLSINAVLKKCIQKLLKIKF